MMCEEEQVPMGTADRVRRLEEHIHHLERRQCLLADRLYDLERFVESPNAYMPNKGRPPSERQGGKSVWQMTLGELRKTCTDLPQQHRVQLEYAIELLRQPYNDVEELQRNVELAVDYLEQAQENG